MAFFKRKQEIKDLKELEIEGLGTEQINQQGYCPPTCKVPIGACDNALFELAFGVGGYSSYMVVGDRNTTKSLIDGLIINGCYKYTPSELSFRLYDVSTSGILKAYEQARLPHIARIGSCIGEKEAIHELNRLLEVIKSRELLFKELREKCGKEINSLFDYNTNAIEQEKGTFKRKKRIVALLIDVKRLLNSPQISEEYAKQICLLINDIAKKGAFVGVHLILTSQELSKDSLDTMLRKSFVERLCGKIVLPLQKKQARSLDFGKIIDKKIKEIVNLKEGECLVTVDEKTVKRVRLSTFTPIEKYIDAISDSVAFFDENTEKLSK